MMASKFCNRCGKYRECDEVFWCGGELYEEDKDAEVLRLFHGLSESMQTAITEIMKVTQEKKDEG